MKQESPAFRYGECQATPINVVENLLKNIDLSKYGNDILEPSAGNGNVCSVVKKAYPDKKNTAFEIRKEETDNLKACADTVAIVDFLI